MKIYALTTLQRYGIEIEVRLFDTIEQCRKEYNLLIKDFENNKDYIVNKGTEHTEIEYDESPTILVSIQTYELNDVINNQVHCVIKGNQDCYEIDNENLYLFNDETKATKQFFDLLYQHRKYGYDVNANLNNYGHVYKEYFGFTNQNFSFDDNDYDWGHCKTKLIKIESEVK